MPIFLVCMKEGNVLTIIKRDTFKEAYDDSVGSNNGEFLVELTEANIKEINEAKEW